MDISVIKDRYYANNAKLLHNIVDSIIFQFGGIYQKDYADFYSLANEVFTDVLERYDGVQDFRKFLKSCLRNRIKTQITNRNRIKRTGDRTAISIETPIGSDGFTVGDTMVSDFDIEDEIYSNDFDFQFKDERIEKFYNNLSDKQKKLLNCITLYILQT